MTPKHRRTWLLSVAALVVGFALLAAACGSSKKSSSTTSSTSTSGGSGGGSSQQKTFANFRIVYDTGTDYLDPALSYTVQGWGAMWNVYLSLLGYKHVNGPDGATLVPALATDMPQVSSDGLTYKLTLRKGLKYSDGKPVKATDFRYAIERDFQADSPGGGFFANIVGADTFSKTKKGHISGITANDATGAITIKLAKPQGDFQNILATIFAAPVPQGTPAKDQSTNPIPSTGPYMIQSYKPNRQFVLVRNPNFKPTANVPATNPDKMTFSIVGDDSAALQQVINGQADYDFHPIPVDRLASVQQKYGSQLKVYTPANTFYFFMNNTVAPFDDVNVRKAVNYAINRQATVRIQGGLASPTENILPPTYPEYEKTNYYPYNLKKAKGLVNAAGVKGMNVTVYTSDNETRRAPEMGQYMVQVLNSIGFNAKLTTINAEVYWTTVGAAATKAQIGFADWFQDYPHPLDWIDVLLNGTRITPTHNNNYANFDESSINAEIAQLKAQPKLDQQVISGWTTLTNKIMKQYAPWAPYLNVQYVDTFNSDMDLSCYVNHVNYQFDFATICQK